MSLFGHCRNSLFIILMMLLIAMNSRFIRNRIKFNIITACYATIFHAHSAWHAHASSIVLIAFSSLPQQEGRRPLSAMIVRLLFSLLLLHQNSLKINDVNFMHRRTMEY